jgi:hypothetical protein
MYISTSLTVPGLVPIQALKINQNPHKFGDGEGWMGIVELDGDRVGELLPSLLVLLEAADNIVKRGGTPEVLLLQSELLPAFEAVES